jgi:hypothetical protein
MTRRAILAVVLTLATAICICLGVLLSSGGAAAAATPSAAASPTQAAEF